VSMVVGGSSKRADLRHRGLRLRRLHGAAFFIFHAAPPAVPRTYAPDGPWAEGTPTLTKLIVWAWWGLFLGEGRELPEIEARPPE
jgi:hypothetical protein